MITDGPITFTGLIRFLSRVMGLERFTNDFDHGYIDFGRMRIVFGKVTFTPSWTDGTDHAYSGAHTDTIPASLKDTTATVIATIRDSRVSARSAWLTYASMTAVDTVSFYVAAPDNAEVDVNTIEIQYLVIGGVP